MCFCIIFVCVFIYLFIYLFVFLLFISQNKVSFVLHLLVITIELLELDMKCYT